MRDSNKVKIKIIRHGKTPLNERHCYIGSTDEPLSENGIKELKELSKKNIYGNVEKVFVSPMKRACMTKDVIYEGVEFEIIEEFRELDFGSFEGKNYEELKDNLHYRKWVDKSRGVSGEELEKIYGKYHLSDENITLPEEMANYKSRVSKGLKSVLKKSKGFNTISIVAHGGTLMAIAEEYLNEDYYKTMLKNGEGLELEIDYTENDGDIEISHISICDRICA